MSPNAPWIESATVTAKGKQSDIKLVWEDKSHAPGDETGFYVYYVWGPWGFTWKEVSYDCMPMPIVDQPDRVSCTDRNVPKEVPSDSVSYRVRSYAIVNEGGVDREILSPVTQEISLDPARSGTVTFLAPESSTSLTDIGSALQSFTAQQATDPDALFADLQTDSLERFLLFADRQ